MGRDRAAYMREYRARRRAEDVEDDAALAGVSPDAWRTAKSLDQVIAEARIAELEDEVRHLKAELAKRPSGLTHATGGNAFSTRPFTPVPKRK